MLVESSEKLEGNARFEGISIDVAQELARLLGFNFTIKLVDDGNVSLSVFGVSNVMYLLCFDKELL